MMLGFHPGILRLALEVCAFTRYLALEGVAGEGVDTLSAILAGTSFATDLLYLVVTGPCDRLMARWPSINLSAVVDDLAAQVVGTEGRVAPVIQEVTDQLVGDLSAIGCMVSQGEEWLPGGKTVVVTTSDACRDRITPPLRRKGILTGRRARHLGVDYTPGARGRGNRPVAKARLKGVRARVDRVVRLRLTGRAITRVLRSAVVPASAHGTGVTGVTDGFLHELSSQAHRAYGHASGRSAYARLYLSGGVPGAKDAVAPIIDWARAAFDSRVPREVQVAGWKTMCGQVGLDARPTMAAEGPAGAAGAAALRIGWQMVGPFVFREVNGNLLDVTVEAPETVKKAALESFDDWAARGSMLYEQIGGPPYLEPLLTVCNAKATTAKVAGSLKAMAEGAWPLQASL